MTSLEFAESDTESSEFTLCHLEMAVKAKELPYKSQSTEKYLIKNFIVLQVIENLLD